MAWHDKLGIRSTWRGPINLDTPLLHHTVDPRDSGCSATSLLPGEDFKQKISFRSNGGMHKRLGTSQGRYLPSHDLLLP